MATLADCITSGETALQQLYALQTTAMKQGNLATQKALEDDVDDLTYKLTQLQSQQIASNNQQLSALNTQLGTVTQSAQTALGDLNQLTTVLTNIVTAAKMLDGILSIVAKA